MAEETSKVTEKVYCYDHPSAYQNDNALISAIMSKGSDSTNGAMWNNPFIYLVWMMMFRNGWNNNGEVTTGENFNSRQIAAMQDTINTNHNNDLALQAINGNTAATQQLATAMNANFSQVSAAVSSVKSAIEQTAGTVNFSAERVINSVLLGNKDLLQTISQCCCENKLLVTTQGYEARLQNEQQTNILQNSIENARQATVNGFANIGFQNSQNTSAIIQNNNANTQRIVDTMNAHWNQDLQIKYQDAKNELSQSQQTNALTSQLTAIAAAIAKIPTSTTTATA